MIMKTYPLLAGFSPAPLLHFRLRQWGATGLAFLFVLAFGASGNALATDFDRSCDSPVSCSPCNPCKACSCGPCEEATCQPCDAVACKTEESPTLFTHRINKALEKRGMKRTKVFGWAQTGITVNEYDAQNAYGRTTPSPTSRKLDYDSGNGHLLGTEQQSDWKLSQLWLGAVRTIEATEGLDWGFRFDSVYGTDARYCQAFGDNSTDSLWGDGDYYVGFTQYYAEAGNKTLKGKVGKFVTDMAYEPIAAPGTYFYSHSYACYSSPLHVSGAGLEFSPTAKWTFFAAWTAGYHTSLENRFDDDGFLFKTTYRPNKTMSIAYNLYTGTNNGFNRRSVAESLATARNYTKADILAQTLVFTWNLNKRWKWMIEGHWSSYDYEGALDAGNTLFDYDTYVQGISQHLIYTVNKKLSFGVRLEWLDTRGGFFDLPPLTGGQGSEIYEITLGANWHPKPWLNIRPELRYDWSDYNSGYRPFDYGRQSNQFTAGLGLMVIF